MWCRGATSRRRRGAHQPAGRAAIQRHLAGQLRNAHILHDAFRVLHVVLLRGHAGCSTVQVRYPAADDSCNMALWLPQLPCVTPLSAELASSYLVEAWYRFNISLSS